MRVDVALMLALGIATAACGVDGPDGTSQPPATDASVSTTPILDRDAAIAAAIDVRADGCGPRVGFGSGTVIPGGDIVTAAHVIAGASSVEVIDVDGQHAAGNVIFFDPDLDLAVVRPAEPVGTPLPIRVADARRDDVGMLVRIRERDLDPGVGIDLTVEVIEVDVRVVREVNISTTDIYLERDVVRDGFEIDSAIDPGDSGAMVVLPGGGTGIVWARSNLTSGRAWAIDLPADVIDGTALAGELRAVDVGRCVP